MDTLRAILTPQLLLNVYRLKFPWAKGELPSGAKVGAYHFTPNSDYRQSFYDLIFHQALIPISRLPLSELLKLDLTQSLPTPNTTDYPEQALGLVLILDQGTRGLASGYGARYTPSFFDHICLKLAEQLVALPTHLRPDRKEAWLARGYSFDDYVVRTLWVWGPLVHSDDFMVRGRQAVKDWCHTVRAEIEAHSGMKDPFAPLEAQDDLDVNLFANMFVEGPPSKSFSDQTKEATMTDYGFWYIRIINSHFVLTDTCGHYPFWVRPRGLEWTEKDREVLEKEPRYMAIEYAGEETMKLIRQDYLDGVWRPLMPTPQYEKA